MVYFVGSKRDDIINSFADVVEILQFIWIVFVDSIFLKPLIASDEFPFSID